MHAFIPIEQVYVPEDRQRQEFDAAAINELQDSIQTNGLLQAIVVREQDGKTMLVAGERRLMAVGQIWSFGGSFKYGGVEVVPGRIPYLNVGELTPLERMRAEYEENERRVNLSWQEKARATKLLSDLLYLEAETAGRPAPTATQVAALRRPEAVLLGDAITTASREVAICRYLDDPEVKKAPTLRDATKLIKRRESAAKAQALGEALGPQVIANSHTLIHADVFEWAMTAAINQFDVVLTDPPYGMEADDFGDSGGKAAGGHLYADGAEIVTRFIKDLPAVLFAITKPNAHTYIFCDIEFFPFWKSSMQASGWKVFRTPLIWHKPAAYRAPWPDKGPQRKYETLLFAAKGEMKVTKMVGDVLTYPADDNLGHQAQKPVDLFIDLLRRSTVPGMRVLDCCAGSGPIFAAAQECKLFATGVEKDAVAYGIAAKRIQQLRGGQ